VIKSNRLAWATASFSETVWSDPMLSGAQFLTR
jgi:hypothetical protein